MGKIDYNIKLLIFENDTGELKNKHINLIEETAHGVHVQYFDIEKNEPYDKPFFLPWHMVKKIKEVEHE